MSRKIVFVNQAAGYLAIDIINEFAGVFDEVALISADIRVQDVELDPKVRISRVIQKSRRTNVSRLVRWIVATVQIALLLMTRFRGFEIFYFSVPPFAYFTSLLLRRRFSLLMWDVYPDALSIMGLQEGHPVYRLWGGINKRLFVRAYRLYTIGESPAKMMSRYVPVEKVSVIPLWAGLKDAGPVPKGDNPFIHENGLEGKFIIQYSGNIGGSHNIESLVEVARLTSADEDILYLLIARGTKVPQVKALIDEHKLGNVILMPFQPDHLIRYSLAAADISVILIEAKAAEVMLPSKIFNLLTVGSPLMGISPVHSELNRMIEAYGVGRNFEKSDHQGMVAFIRQLKDSPGCLEDYRARALLASKQFTSENARKYLESYINTERDL
jgi:hypothetical protein